MHGYEQIKAKDIRDMLVRHGMSQKDADSIKGKNVLIYEAQQMGISPVAIEELATSSQDDLDVLADVDLTEAEVLSDGPLMARSDDDVENGENLYRPIYGKPGWSDFVMEHFEDNELDNGKPKVEGLRRVAELLLGEITFSGPTQIIPVGGTSYDDPGRCTCLYEVEICFTAHANLMDNYLDLTQYQGPIRKFRAAAGVYVGNTDEIFARYPEAMSETRAEGRALRKALLLNGITAEEATSEGVDSVSNFKRRTDQEKWDDESNEITSAQKSFIKTKCKALGVEADKFINKKYHMGHSDEPTYNTLDDVPKNIAATMIKELNRYQTETGTDESRNIPKEILEKDDA